VTNGVALCALHHRSYDTGLVTFDESYAIKVSAISAGALKAEGRSGGIVGFRTALRPTLFLPPKQALRPSLSMVKKANALRGWT
jgi:putative restriction endonuclease